jgi:hypothetical protein
LNTPLRRLAAAASLSLFSLASHAQQTAPLKTQVASRVDAMYPWLDLVYKDLHAHPEIAFQEVRTAGKLAAKCASSASR